MSSQNDHPKVLTTQAARQGKELGSVRYVLWISMTLAVIAGVIIYYVILG
ncbi:MAG TPA: hypothetical protein VIJ72_07095 [Rhizomicrobium sp.]